MAFAYTKSTGGGETVGRLRFQAGTFTNAATDSGGAITTGLRHIYGCGVFYTSHLGTEVPKVTVSGGTMTIVTSDGADGNWWAIGRV